MGQNWELTEKEREILRLRKLGRTFRQVCTEAKVSPNEITIAEQKERGEYRPPPSKEELAQLKNKTSLPAQDYSRMYRLFSKDWSPRLVAIEMNLPGDFVNEHYLLFLDMKRWFMVTELYKVGGEENFRATSDFISFLKYNGYNLKNVGAILNYAEQVYLEEINLQELRRENDSLLNQKLGLKSNINTLKEENAELKKENQRLHEENNKEVRRAQKIKEWIDANPGITTAQIVDKKIAEALLSNYTMMDCTFPAVIQAMRANPDYARFLMNPDPRAVHPIVHQYQNGFQKYCEGVWMQMKDVAYQYCTQNFADKIRNDMAMI